MLVLGSTDWIEIVGARAKGDCVLAAKHRELPQYGPPSKVAQIEFPLRQWDGPVGEWSEHLGKGRGQIHSLDGGEPRRSCQEVEVAKCLRRARDQAFWFSGFSTVRMPESWRPWVATLEDAPDWLLSLDATIRQQISSRTGGMPDVVAWSDLDPLRSAIFIECKGRGEAFKPEQEDWAWAAVRAGIRPTQIAVAVRPF